MFPNSANTGVSVLASNELDCGAFKVVSRRPVISPMGPGAG